MVIYTLQNIFQSVHIFILESSNEKKKQFFNLEVKYTFSQFVQVIG